MRRGEIRWCTLRPPDKRRPVLILTRNSALGVLTGVTIAPVTSSIRNIPTHVLLTPAEDGVQHVCAINLDTIQTIQKQQLGPLVTTLSATRMSEVEHAICFALGMDQFLT
ncbi:MAG: PemK family transcriptional regulator [Chloroflexi bacterium]|nr:MAG: PemK family transcriptional regulator [Chloroflexota bacterium]